MVNELKMNQVYSAIRENGLHAFDDEALAKLLSIFNVNELDIFERDAYDKLGGTKGYDRIRRIRPLVEFYTKKEIYDFKNSNLFSRYMEALQNKTYKELFQNLSVTDLAKIKKYVYLVPHVDNTSIEASKKIIKLITREISRKEANKDLKFS